MLLGLFATMDQSHAPSDRRFVPPVERIFASPNGRFRLRVFSLDDWKTREPMAELRRNKRLVWKARLPHSHGPRDATVLDSGGIVLLDEWINVASLRAITLIDAKGRTKAVFEHKAVLGILGQASSDLSRLARLGPYGRGLWMASRPVVRGNVVEIAVGGKRLLIDTDQRTLSARD